jgi:hypothetical protein
MKFKEQKAILTSAFVMITSFPILAFLSIIQFLGKKCICSAIRPKNPNMNILIGISNYDWMMLHERIDKAL